MWAFPYPSSVFPPKSSVRISTNSSHANSLSSKELVIFVSLKTENRGEDYNRRIQHLCKEGHLKRALKVLSKEFNPTQQTYEALILSCGIQRSLSKAFLVHKSLIENGFQQDSFLATKLINLYSELDSLDYAYDVFDGISDKTIFVWNAILRAFSMAGKGEEALALYREMVRGGVSSDRFTYTYILKACVTSYYSKFLLNKGREIHAHIFRSGFESRIHAVTTLINMYANFGHLHYSRRLFDEMPKRNEVTWSAMIAGYVNNNQSLQALELFKSMINYPHCIVPNSVTMVSVLQACGYLAALGHGKAVHGYILRTNLDSILTVLNSLITMYVKCGCLDMGCRVFERMRKRDVVTWNAMISGYGVHGFGKDSIKKFEEMIESGISPTIVTFVSVLGACSHAGLVEEGKKLFDAMFSKHKIAPCAEHYACMVDLLGRSGRLHEAEKIIEEMRIEPGPTVWGSLLGASRIHGNVELAERATVHLFELEPMNAGNYVLLADIYAGAKMWGDVNRVKKLLENRGLQKVPGCSWIEVKKKIYSFVSVDQLNPQIEQLHAFLFNLSNEMKDRGYVPETKGVLYDLDQAEKEKIVLGHSEKLAVAFGLINTRYGDTIRITKNLRLCEDCHSVTKFVSEFAHREIIVRDVNRVHHFRDGLCSCSDYW